MNGVDYPLRFFNMLHFQRPKTLNEIFKWCIILNESHGLLDRLTDTMARYPITHIEITNDIVTEIYSGMYYYILTQEFSSILEINGRRDYLKLPYILLSNTSGPLGTSPGNFLDASSSYGIGSYATVGFSGSRNSYFEFNIGEWVEDVNSNAKAADLAKAVAYKYGLSYTDLAASNHINKYIKYIQSYSEELGQFIVYIPGITPESDINNFDLIVTDELGNHYIRGLQILLLQPLTTVADGSEGIIFPYTNDGMSL
jgi:hypothetical protein